MALVANWLELGHELGIDFARITPQEFVRGCDHELEHWETVGGDARIIAGIASDHLKENPYYYALLEKVERGDNQKKATGYNDLLRPLSENEIEQMAIVTPDDIRATKKQTPGAMRKLLDAE